PAWALFQPGKPSWEGEGHPYELLVRSPWLIVGDRKNVTMDKEHPWVGQHSPVIAADAKGAGLVQDRLGLVGGRRYAGRIALAGPPRAAAGRVSLVWGEGGSDRQNVAVDPQGDEFKTVPLSFPAGASTDNGRLEVVASGQGSVRVGAVSLMPADNVYGW